MTKSLDGAVSQDDPSISRHEAHEYNQNLKADEIGESKFPSLPGEFKKGLLNADWSVDRDSSGKSRRQPCRIMHRKAEL